jgi:hypothetical protein
VVRVAANVNMIVDEKVDRVMLVCPAADASLNVSRAVAEVVLEMKLGGGLEAGESDGGGD